MIGSLIGAGVSLVGNILGGIANNNAIKRNMRAIAQSKADNQAWYDRRYNEDATQRASAQRAMEQARQMLADRTKAAQGRMAVMGGTDESAIAEQEAASKAIADTTSQIAANADARKDAIEQQYMQTKAQYNQQEQQMRLQKANSGIAGLF